jgi:EpsI family protein
MAKKTHIQWVLILLLATGLAARLWLASRPIHEQVSFTLSRLPTQLGDQRSVELPLTPFEVELLSPDGGEILQRRYGNGEEAIWLAAVQSATDWRVQHPPQVCYIAQGWHIDEKNGRELEISKDRKFSVERMVVHKEGYQRLVYYFYSDGYHWTASYFLRIFHSLIDRMLYAQVNTWLMVQISTPIADADDEARLALAATQIFTAYQ